MSALEAARQEQRDALDLLTRKNGAYGDGNIALTGLKGVAVRSLDKAMRLKSLVLDGAAAGDEQIEDTLRDQMNYSLIGLLLLRGQWGPLEEEEVADVSLADLHTVIRRWAHARPHDDAGLDYAEGWLDCLELMMGEQPRPVGRRLAAVDSWMLEAARRGR